MACLSSLVNSDVLDHDVLDDQQVADLRAGEFEGAGLDEFAVLDDLLRALLRGGFLESLLDPGRDEGVERFAADSPETI